MRVAHPLFVNGAQWSDVRQGNKPDCFLLASLAAEALVSPAQLERSIHRESSRAVSVTFAGLGATVTMPDGFDKAGASPSASGETWVNAAERAWYLLEKRRPELKEATCETALKAITGSATETYATSDERIPEAQMCELTWNRLCRSVEVPPDSKESHAPLREPMVANTPAANFFATLLNSLIAVLRWLQLVGGSGYCPSHSYAIIAVGYSHALGRYVQLYNPQGCHDARRDGPDDGLFAVPLGEFIAHMETYTGLRATPASATSATI